MASFIGTRLFSENISNFITDSGKRIIEFIRILSVSSQVQYTEPAACIPQSYFWQLRFLKKNRHHLYSNNRTIRNNAKNTFTNYVDKILSYFDHLPPYVDIFYLIKVDKMWHFWTTYPPLLVNVVWERPLMGKSLHFHPSFPTFKQLCGMTLGQFDAILRLSSVWKTPDVCKIQS